MTGGHHDDRAEVDDDRPVVGTPVFSVREGVLPLPGPRATSKTASRVATCARAWDVDLGGVDVEDLEDVA